MSGEVNILLAVLIVAGLIYGWKSEKRRIGDVEIDTTDDGGGMWVTMIDLDD